ncbi:MAG: glycosyltransferase [Peptococcaceae bacterium]|nr:glycosyltransferase [Peptococcaceae bacterium]
MASATVLMTLMNLEIGGAETHTVLLARHMKEMGYRVLIASAGGVYEDLLAGQGIRHYQLPLDKSGFGSLYRSVWALQRIIKEEKVSLIHAHARIPAFAASFVSSFTGVKMLTTAHAVFATGFPKGYLSRWGEATIAVSEDVKNHLINAFGLPEKNIVLIPNGIDADHFRPGQSGTDDIRATITDDNDKMVIVYVSRLDRPLASVATNLIRACGDFAGILPVKLVIAGDGVCYGDVAAEAKKVNDKTGTEIVRLLGARTDINLLLDAADLAAGVSRVALEAMACGKNVILAGGEGFGGLMKETDLPMFEKDNFTGRQFDKLATVEDFQQAIKEFAGLPEAEKKQRGYAFRQHVIDHYSSLYMARETAKVYEKLIGN